MRLQQPMLTVLVIFTAIATACTSRSNSSWELPIIFGESIEQVRQLLGGPTYTIDLTRERSECNVPCLIPFEPGDTEDWYYSSGIVANYQQGRVFRVTLHRHISYRGFLSYSGKIVEGISLNDTRENILHKLGEPTKVEETEELGDPISGKKTGPGVPAVFPAQEVYYWRRQNYTIEVQFLKQPQSVDKKRGIVWPKGEVMYIKVYQ